MSEYPQKEFYRLSEVCQYTDTQPYVLRFWESEFPQLKPEKSTSGQRVYTGKDIDLVRRIKELLYEEEYTLDGARKALSTESSRGRKAGAAKSRSRSSKKGAREHSTRQTAQAAKADAEAPTKRKPASSARSPRELDTVPRRRYQDAIDEIDHLRLQLKDAEKNLHRAETAAVEAEKQAERQGQRADLAIERLEKLLEILS